MELTTEPDTSRPVFHNANLPDPGEQFTAHDTFGMGERARPSKEGTS